MCGEFILQVTTSQTNIRTHKQVVKDIAFAASPPRYGTPKAIGRQGYHKKSRTGHRVKFSHLLCTHLSPLVLCALLIGFHLDSPSRV